ncbi:H-2 class II histocompatibility antigen, E-S beta chain-like [Puntigrus tetrazona]|uniref:H-2 class II histocompatibility antigen, E-S beta chain-like n=1 Tax=Puntigrus tetrazona TaxID=1606681 RepID=UPI001C8965B1|nr:H-2 class II histocompatibility antigen, E-S beta chain-like [Puntigrus tetrazona]
MSLLKLLNCHLILILALFIGAESANEHYSARWSRCFFSALDYSDMVYIDSFYFNKFLLIQFNSTLGKFVGFNEYGMNLAAQFNNSTFVNAEMASVNSECGFHIKIRYPQIHDKTVKPKVKLSVVKQEDGRNPAVFMCSAYEFYPKYIKISWLRNGEVMTSEDTALMEMADGDWYYQIHSELAYIPKYGENISCMVDHASLTEPIFVNWDSSLPTSERDKITIGVCVLVLGIIIAAAGFIYCQKKTGRKFVRCAATD